MRLPVVLVVVGVAAVLLPSPALADTISGGQRADVIRGTSSPDVILGRGGNDRLSGRSGADLLVGGRGRDTLICGPGLDFVVADRTDRIDRTCEVVVRRLGASVPGAVVQPASTSPSSEQDGSVDTESSSGEILLPWLIGPEDPDWTQGIVRFLLGVAGALVTTYLFLGEFLPSMGGKAEYDSQRWELKSKIDERDKILGERKELIGKDPLAQDRVQALEKYTSDLTGEIDELRDGLTRERWLLTLAGFPVYVILGGAFATVFATTLPQALLIGFGWVAVADRLGLKRETEAKDKLRGKEIETVKKEAAAVAVKLNDERARVETELAATREREDSLEEELAAAQKQKDAADASLAKYKEATEELARQVQELRGPGASTAGDQR